MPSRPLRRAAVALHRWVGLGIAAFLLVTALTGSAIAFYDEIEAWLIPELVLAPAPRPDAVMIDALRLREVVGANHPKAEVNWVELHRLLGRTQVFGLSARAGGAVLGNDEVFVDPYRGRIVGERKRGDLRQGLRNLMPFVYELHESLALGQTGSVVLGIAALLWTIDCFVGLYLTFPLAPARAGSGEPRRHRKLGIWAARWRTAWGLRFGVGLSKLVFDLHRALSLWAWLGLLVLAWSAVGFNLPEAYRPVMRAFGYVEDRPLPEVPEAATTKLAGLGWEGALGRARVLMAEQARVHGFEVLRERSISHDAALGLYQYRTLSTLDVGRKLGNTTLFLDDSSGALVSLSLPTGRGIANTVDTWISNLHTASVGGLAMQVVVCGLGLIIAVVTLTGVDIWWRRRRARRGRREGAGLFRCGGDSDFASEKPSQAANR